MTKAKSGTVMAAHAFEYDMPPDLGEFFDGMGNNTDEHQPIKKKRVR